MIYYILYCFNIFGCSALLRDIHNINFESISKIDRGKIVTFIEVSVLSHTILTTSDKMGRGDGDYLVM